ncbi:DNA-binding transcriptional regulator, LysR family [Variovorax sp. OK605]|jgi:DNA-binding transcriptional LysR family regulator|uniref:LysR family transcriptional regulator n=1 Tax=unclassified Variovorax TaxID=663243 RepID=UPI0008BCE1A1|nr:MULTISPECIES: LysR family transcriptional regulator [unclassified Variovorax]SEK08493.1 DNA-binding transcriptional regulator, LysR family [Variovorax sp. OK202]SFD56475.1 DNA-binding transcriptional regulator, LysR family [Variovorax sp. OK212]SFP86188.1 DNA-binding transcriptional regulator, LysR family [Variovorax sp. OK605]
MNSNSKKGLPDWDLLVSWIAVIESGSVSDAAQLLKISQAAVSQRIKQLETFFDTALLDRTTRPAQPTAAGQRLFEHAKELLTQADQLVESVRSVSRAKRMTVRIGCVDSFAATVGPMLIKGLSGSSHQIRLWSGITPTLDASIESRQLDLAVTTSLHGSAGIARTPLFSEKFYAVLPPGFDAGPLGSLAELERQLKFIRYSARSVIGQQVDDYLQRSGDMLERTYEFDTTDPLLSLVANGMGFALTTPLCIWQSRQFLPDIRVLPMSAFVRRGRPYVDVSRTFYLAYRQGELGALPTEVRDLIRIAVKRQLSREITDALQLDADALVASESGD